MASLGDQMGVIIQATLDKASSKTTINEQLKQIKADPIKLDIQLDQAALNKAQKQTTKVFQEVAASQRKLLADDTISTRGKIIQANLQRIKDTTKSIGNDPTLTKRWQEIFDSAKVASTSAEIQNLNAKVSLLKKESGAVSDNFTKAFKAYLLVKALQLVKTGISEVISEVKDLDRSLTDFNKVADLSGEKLSAFVNRAYEAGEQIGRTGKDVIDATARFKQAGYNLDTALEHGKTSLIMNNVGDGIDSAADSASNLIAILKGYNIADADALKVVDRINKVSNESPVGFDKLIDGLVRVSGTMSQTGTSIDETIGLLTGGYVQLQNMEKNATGLITISSRLRGISEDGEAIEGLAPKLQSAFKSIANIDIEDANGKLRSIYDIIKDLAEVYPTLTSKQQQYLTELASGQRQSPVLAAIIQQWGSVQQAIEQSTASLGSATRENEIFMNSVEGHANRFHSAWQRVATTALESDTVKGVYDLGTAILDVIDNFGGLQNALLLVTGLLTATKLDTVTGFLKQTVGTIPGIVKALQLAKAEGLSFAAALKTVGISASTAQIAVAGLTLGATLLFGIISSVNQAHEQATQKSIDSGKAAVKEAGSLLDLYSAYDKLSKVTDRTNAQESEYGSLLSRITEALGSKAKALDGLKQGTEEYTKALREATQAEIQNQSYVAAAGAGAAKQKLNDMRGTPVASKRMTVKFSSEGNIFGSDFPSADISAQIRDVLQPYFSNKIANQDIYDNIGNADVVDYYYDVVKARNLILAESQEMNDITLLEGHAYKELTRVIDEYSSAIEDYVALEIQRQQLFYMGQNGVPQTIDEYNAMADTIIAATSAGEEYAAVIRKKVVPAQTRLASGNDSSSSGNITSAANTSSLDALTKTYQNRIDRIEAEKTALDNIIADKAGAGKEIVADDYNLLLEKANNKLAVLVEQRDALTAMLAEQADDGTLEEGSNAWHEWQSALESVNKQIHTENQEIRAVNDALNGLPIDILKILLDRLKANKDAIQGRIDLASAKGVTPASSDYSDLIDNADREIARREDINAELKKQQASMDIVSEKYQQIRREIEDNDRAIAEAKQNQEQWRKSVVGTKNAYQDYVNAKSRPNDADSYDNLSGALKTLQDGLKSGRVGTEEFKAALKLMVPENLHGNLNEIRKYVTDLNKLFSEDNKGLTAFVAKLEKLKLAEFDPKTKKFRLLETDITELANQMNLTEDATKAMLKALNDYSLSDLNIGKDILEPESKQPIVVPVEADTAGANKDVDDFVANASKKRVTLGVDIKTPPGGSTPPKVPALDSGRDHQTKHETALVGEKRPELLVRDGKAFYLDTPQFVNLKPGDKLFGGAETAKITKGRKGKTWRALDGGFSSLISNAKNFVVGKLNSAASTASKLIQPLITPLKNAVSNALPVVLDTIGKTSGKSNGKGGSSKKSTSDIAKAIEKLEDMFDWVQVALEKAKTASENLIRDAGKAIGYISKNSKLDSVLSSVKKEMALNEQAYTTYMVQAGKVASETRLSSDIIAKVQNGSISIGDYNSETRDAIKLYQDWYEKAQDVKAALQDLEDKQDEIAQMRLDNITSYYSNLDDRLNAKVTSSQNKIDLKNKSGKQVVANDYLEILSQTNAQITLLNERREVLNKEFASLVSSGAIQKDGDAWHKYTGQLEALDSAIVGAKIDLADFKREMASVDVTNLKYTLSGFQQIQQSIQNLMDLRSEQGTALEASDYDTLITNGIKMVANLERQRDLLKTQLFGLDEISEQYQAIQSQISETENQLWQVKVSQEQWNNAIHDLKIKGIQDQITALQKANDEYKRSLEMQQALEDLERAKQRKKLILQDGKFVYVADPKAINDAQGRVDDARHTELIATLEKQIDAIEDLKKSDNVYDSFGNLIPKYDTGTPRTTEGYAYLHDNEMILNPNGVEGLWKLVNNHSAMAAMWGNAVKDMNRYTSYVSAPAPSNAIPSFNIENIEMNGVNDANTFVKEMLRHVPNQLAQQLHKR